MKNFKTVDFSGAKISLEYSINKYTCEKGTKPKLQLVLKFVCFSLNSFSSSVKLGPNCDFVHVLNVLFEVAGLCEMFGAMCAGVRFLSRVNILVSLQIIEVQEAFPTVWTPVSLLPIVPA